MSLCGVCVKSVNRTGQGKVSYGSCKSFFHINCVNKTKNDLSCLENKIWTCQKCSSIDLSEVSETLTIRDEMKSLTTMKTEILSGQVSLHEDFNELSKLLHEQIEIIKQHKCEIELLKSENADVETLVRI